MPGPEASEVLASIRSTISSLKGIGEDHGDISGAENLPTAFQAVAAHLGVVIDTFEEVRKQIWQRNDDNIWAEMKPTMAECKNKADSLEILFRKVVLAAAPNRMEAYRLAVHETGGRVEILMKAIMKNAKDLLTADEDMKIAVGSQLTTLIEAIEAVSSIPPSLEDESSMLGINNYGSGPQNIHTGSGNQNNNTGSGQQFIGSTFRGFDPFSRQ